MQKNEIKIGQHFWGISSNELVVLLKCENGFFVCGGWEIPISESEFEFVKLIEKPEGYENHKLYYQ